MPSTGASLVCEAVADIDAVETEEWLEALDAVVEQDGPKRAHDLVERVVERARFKGAAIEYVGPTPYVNTIPAEEEPPLPGDPAMERRVRSLIRWNAIAMILRANKESSELGGHIASFQSAALLYEIGFNHFWRAPSAEHGGDLVYIQGHSSPGIYARAYLEGRLSEEQLEGFRQEVSRDGISSYPHPWLMPEFWQFPTVSMGLGPIMAIYQARFARYLEDRGIAETKNRKVWCFLGDGETDEPESLGAIALAGREKLSNLVFVVNCNLQRLDGPVHGNGKIIQELETIFRGAGWNVIKVVWGDRWDPLLADDHDGLLVRRMEEAVDGEYQTYKARDGAYVREKFFGKYEELAKRVENMSDEEIWALNRGGHDARKVYAAYAAAQGATRRPTVVLAKTIKGYGMGEAGEGQNITHSQKKMNEEALKAFRDRFELDISEEEIADVSFHRPPDDSDEIRYLKERRERLGGYLPARRRRVDEPLPVPPLETFQSQLDGTDDREVSTTMAFVRVLAALIRDKEIGDRVVPIVPDETRTFGMEGMFRQLGIYSHVGQLYEPEDAGSLMFYREDQKGQVLQEGITEAGAMSSWIAAATSYSNHGVQMIPFYLFYSMFGFQRIGDLAWAAGDSRARGFLLGGTAGRTTLNGEGLQHEDGHSHLLVGDCPELRLVRPGLRLRARRDRPGRPAPDDRRAGGRLLLPHDHERELPRTPRSRRARRRGSCAGCTASPRATARRCGCSARARSCARSRRRLSFFARTSSIAADVWSVTSFTELRRDGLAREREARLGHPATWAKPWIEECLGGAETPVVAATDYMKALPDGIREWVPGRFDVLGTDGFGRSDLRKHLRRFFEVDRHHVVVAALRALEREGEVTSSIVADAIKKYGIDAEAPDPAVS